MTRDEKARLEAEAAAGDRAMRQLEILGDLFTELERAISERFVRLSAADLARDKEQLERLKWAQLGVEAARSILTSRIETGRFAEEQLTDALERGLGRIDAG